jgi:hypothetical protein
MGKKGKEDVKSHYVNPMTSEMVVADDEPEAVEEIKEADIETAKPAETVEDMGPSPIAVACGQLVAALKLFPEKFLALSTMQKIALVMGTGICCLIILIIVIVVLITTMGSDDEATAPTVQLAAAPPPPVLVEVPAPACIPANCRFLFLEPGGVCESVGMCFDMDQCGACGASADCAGDCAACAAAGPCAECYDGTYALSVPSDATCIPQKCQATYDGAHVGVGTCETDGPCFDDEVCGACGASESCTGVCAICREAGACRECFDGTWSDAFRQDLGFTAALTFADLDIAELEPGSPARTEFENVFKVDISAGLNALCSGCAYEITFHDVNIDAISAGSVVVDYTVTAPAAVYQQVTETFVLLADADINEMFSACNSGCEMSEVQVTHKSGESFLSCQDMTDIAAAEAFCLKAGNPKASVVVICNSVTADAELLGTICAAVGVNEMARILCDDVGYDADTCAYSNIHRTHARTRREYYPKNSVADCTQDYQVSS